MAVNKIFEVSLEMWTLINIVYQTESSTRIVEVRFVCSKMNYHLAARRRNHSESVTPTKSTTFLDTVNFSHFILVYLYHLALHLDNYGEIISRNLQYFASQ